MDGPSLVDDRIVVVDEILGFRDGVRIHVGPGRYQLGARRSFVYMWRNGRILSCEEVAIMASSGKLYLSAANALLGSDNEEKTVSAHQYYRRVLGIQAVYLKTTCELREESYRNPANVMSMVYNTFYPSTKLCGGLPCRTLIC